MEKLKKIVERQLKTQLYQAEFTMRSDSSKNITIITDNLRGVCGITVVTPETGGSTDRGPGVEETKMKVKFFMIEPDLTKQLIRMSKESANIEGIYSFIPRIRTAQQVISRIYRPKTTAIAEE